MKTAVITGASAGVGAAVAKAMLADGYYVALAGRRGELLEQVADGFDTALVVPTDVADEHAVAALFEKVERQWGRVDVLFNNAGVSGPYGAPDQIGIEAWRAAVDVNLTGMFLCASAAMALMKKQNPRGGRIINNGSIAAHSPRPNGIAYSATKSAISGLTRSISLDGRGHDIACGQIDIGNAATDMTSRMAQGVPQADGTTRAEPTFDVVHVAEAVLFMAGLPLSANVQTMTIMATEMPFIGRG